MISVPRSAIQETNTVALEFHWADNIQKIGDISEFFLNGDNAPGTKSELCAGRKIMNDEL